MYFLKNYKKIRLLSLMGFFHLSKSGIEKGRYKNHKDKNNSKILNTELN